MLHFFGTPCTNPTSPFFSELKHGLPRETFAEFELTQEVRSLIHNISELTENCFNLINPIRISATWRFSPTGLSLKKTAWPHRRL